MFYILGQMRAQTFISHSYIFWDRLSWFCENLLLQKCRQIFDESDYNAFIFFHLFVFFTEATISFGFV